MTTGPRSHVDAPRLALERGLRAEVCRLRSQQRRLVPTILHAGVPGGPRCALEPPESGLDHELRVLLASTLLERALRQGAEGRVLWLTRALAGTWHDDDAAWCGPAYDALRALGLDDGSFAVVTRSGWHEPRADRSETYHRSWRSLPGGSG